MSLLSRAAILAAEDLRHVDVPVPEWPDANGAPGVVRLQQMSALAMTAWQRDMDKPENEGLGLAVILQHTVVDDSGSTVFTPDDIAALIKKNFDVLVRLQHEALKINRLGAKAEAALKKD